MFLLLEGLSPGKWTREEQKEVNWETVLTDVEESNNHEETKFMK